MDLFWIHTAGDEDIRNLCGAHTLTLTHTCTHSPHIPLLAWLLGHVKNWMRNLSLSPQMNVCVCVSVCATWRIGFLFTCLWNKATVQFKLLLDILLISHRPILSTAYVCVCELIHTTGHCTVLLHGCGLLQMLLCVVYSVVCGFSLCICEQDASFQQYPNCCPSNVIAGLQTEHVADHQFGVSSFYGAMASEGSVGEKNSAVCVWEKRGRGQRGECEEHDSFLAVTVLPALTRTHSQTLNSSESRASALHRAAGISE